MTERIVRVVAAVVVRQGEVLITRRLADAERGGLWEFPGGKVEEGETEPEALGRELEEELDCAVEVGPLLLRHRHRYPDLAVELAFYRCELKVNAAPRALGVAALAWVPRQALGSFPFCEADVPVLGELVRLAGEAIR